MSKRKKAEKNPEPKGACLEVVRRFAHLLPDAELDRIAVQILEIRGYICIPPEVVAKGMKRTG